MLLDQFLDSLFLKELEVVLLKLEEDGRTSGQVDGRLSIFLDSEGATSRGLPSVLLVSDSLRDDSNPISNQVS